MSNVKRPSGDCRQFHVRGRDGVATISLFDGRVTAYGSAPSFKRLARLTEAGLRAYAAEHGWQLEPARVRM